MDQPRALPSREELAERRARRAERRRQQRPEPAPWPPKGTGLPTMEEMEQASIMVAPIGCHLVPIPFPKPKGATP